MKLKIVLLIYCIPLMVKAQNSKGAKFKNQGESRGIAWVKAANWEEVKSIAKKENKYIFVDLYATWCRPCKRMDEEVYENEQVGKCLNSKYISVKIQMDKTKNDNEQIKSWYDDAEKMTKQYNISSYPSFLFFSPDGVVVHKQIGYKTIKDFMQISLDALDNQKQYFTLLSRYKEKELDGPSTKLLIRMCKSFGEKVLSQKIANEYLGQIGNKALQSSEDKLILFEFKKTDNAKRIAYDYINSLVSERMYQKESIELMANFIESTKDSTFRFFYNHNTRIDSVMKKQGYAIKILDYIIDKEEINPYWEAAINEQRISWNKIYKSIKKKYNKIYADRIVLSSKSFLFKYLADKNKKYWKDYLKYALKKIDKFQSDTTDFWQELNLNEVAWYTFLYSNNKKQLSSAIKWMECLTKRHSSEAAYLDTYANLLYKTGKMEDAIKVEEDAYKKSGYDENFKKILSKMKEGEPTWTTEN